MTPRKPKPKWDDPEESRRFIETAEKAEALDPKAGDSWIKKNAPKKAVPQG